MKLRLIAGSLGSRLIDAPTRHVAHPMGERVRGALFNILGDIQGLGVLDPFAGSGALSFEAISRGAISALAIEREPQAQRIIAHNIESLGVADRVTLIRGGCRAWSTHNPDARFDLILADPPYNALQANLIIQLATHLRAGGRLVLSHSASISAPVIPELTLVESRRYADATLSFYKAAP